MKLRLLIGTLMLSAITANAQVATLNENFDNFTAGNTTFPQFGWSAIVAPITGDFPPVPPRMLVVTVTGNPNKYVQSYAGNNSTTPSYLITPQIVAPAGDKTLSFQTTLVTQSPVTGGTIQVGLASNPADMSTFVPVGNLISVTAIGTILDISVPIPASTSSYIVFKFTPTAAHVAIQIDNVVYNTSTSLAVNDATKSKEEVQFAVNAENTALQFVAKKDPKNIEIYSAGAQKVAGGKLSGRSFDISALQTGVYYIIIETVEGSVIKSKFIKK